MISCTYHPPADAVRTVPAGAPFSSASPPPPPCHVRDLSATHAPESNRVYRRTVGLGRLKKRLIAYRLNLQTHSGSCISTKRSPTRGFFMLRGEPAVRRNDVDQSRAEPRLTPLLTGIPPQSKQHNIVLWTFSVRNTLARDREFSPSNRGALM